MGMRSSSSWRSAASASRSCLAKWAMSSGWVRSSSVVSVVGVGGGFVIVCQSAGEVERGVDVVIAGSFLRDAGGGRGGEKEKKEGRLYLGRERSQNDESHTHTHHPHDVPAQTTTPRSTNHQPNPSSPPNFQKKIKLTPKSFNLFPASHPTIHSPLPTTPSPFASHTPKTSLTTSSFRSSEISRVVDSSSSSNKP